MKLEGSIRRWKIAQKYEKVFWKRSLKKGFTEDNGKIKEYYSYYFKIIEKFCNENNEVLEVGGGPVPLIRYFFTKNGILLDPLTDYYKTNFGMPKDIQTVKGMGEKMPFPSEHFDVVISLNTLDHTQNPHDFLNDIRGTLKENGILYLTVNCYSHPLKYYKLMREFIGLGEDKPHPYSFTVRDVNKLLERIGFKVLAVYRGIGDLSRYIHTLKKTNGALAGTPFTNALEFLKKGKILNVIDGMILVILSFRGSIVYEENILDFIFVASK